MRDQLVGHAIREVRLVLVGGKILERQDDERSDPIGGRSNDGRLAQIAGSETTGEDNPERENRGRNQHRPKNAATRLGSRRRKSRRKREDRWAIFRNFAL